MSTEFATQRARMLVTLLGPEFAKNSDHPFFTRLIDLAAASDSSHGAPVDPSRLSASLSALVARLDTTSSVDQESASTDHHNEQTETPALDVTQKSEPERQHSVPETELPQDLVFQHPAVIAVTAKNIGAEQRKKLLDDLPPLVANQVTTLVERLT